MKVKTHFSHHPNSRHMTGYKCLMVIVHVTRAVPRRRQKLPVPSTIVDPPIFGYKHLVVIVPPTGCVNLYV